MSKPVTGPFEKTPGWLDWYDGPSKPRFKVPAGAVDAHCHVFGPGGEYPYAPERKYTPCDASRAQLYALRDHLGFSRNVVVQATCHGADNRAMVDALIHSGGKARGVATVKRSVTDAELKAMHEAGVRGVRFARAGDGPDRACAPTASHCWAASRAARKFPSAPPTRTQSRARRASSASRHRR